MTNTLKYGHDGSQICLDVPEALFDKATEEGEDLVRVLEERRDRRLVETEPIAGGTRLLLNAKRAGRTENDFQKRQKVGKMITAVASIAGRATASQEDPALTVLMSLHRLGDGVRLGMSADIVWPDKTDADMQRDATTAMRLTAAELKSLPKSILNSCVYAQVEKRHGITLETNPAGSCSLDTDGMFYEESEPVAELIGHNIYNHEIQLICLSGLIGLVKD